jgi:peptidoglycan/xylan/chitin deacetylase (PgdA/CDA1 family)
MSRALVLTYHAVDAGPPPLCIEPRLFERHLDLIAQSGARVMTVNELAETIRADLLVGPAVAITFDDGLASVARNAAPLLAERGFTATVFCVARRLGGRSDWPSRAAWAPILPLARAGELGELAAAGWEIGSHGLDHEVLQEGAAHELAESRSSIEEATGAIVSSFAYPYGVVPNGATRALQDGGYSAACTTNVSPVRASADPFALPRVDIHYLRRSALLRLGLSGQLDWYLRLRGSGARIGRLAKPDHVPA